MPPKPKTAENDQQNDQIADGDSQDFAKAVLETTSQAEQELEQIPTDQNEKVIANPQEQQEFENVAPEPIHALEEGQVEEGATTHTEDIPTDIAKDDKKLTLDEWNKLYKTKMRQP